MNKKIVLGLGLCLLLTVINLHRAMDNYGITDAKFKVGVLADESSSSSSGTSYGGYYIDDVTVVITVMDVEWEWDGEGYRLIESLILYDQYIQPWGYTFRIDGGKRICTEGWLYNCVEHDLGNPTYETWLVRDRRDLSTL